MLAVTLILSTLAFACAWRFFAGEKNLLRLFFAFNPLFLVAAKLGEKSSKNILNKFIEARDEKALYDQLPLYIDNMRACLKAGLCLDDALAFTMSKRAWTPAIAVPFGQVVAFRGAGVTMIESLDRAKSALPYNAGGRFIRVLLVSLLIGFTTGGNLASLLEKSQTKIQTSLELQRKIRVYTAQMKMQSMVVALAPVGIAVMLLFLDPERVMFFVNTVFGVFLLLLMIVFYTIGIKMLAKIGSLDV